MIARLHKGRLREYRVLRDRAMRNARLARESLCLPLPRSSQEFWRGVVDGYVRIARANNRELVQLARLLREARGVG